MKDWLAWHQGYDDPAGSLAHRIQVVRRRLTEVLDTLARPQPRLLSLCAGDGRDVIPVLAARTSSSPVAAVLVENDPTLAARASDSSASAGLKTLEAAEPLLRSMSALLLVSIIK